MFPVRRYQTWLWSKQLIPFFPLSTVNFPFSLLSGWAVFWSWFPSFFRSNLVGHGLFSVSGFPFFCDLRFTSLLASSPGSLFWEDRQ